MSYSCKILLDSISETGKRITTFEITFPRIVLAEFNTHRMFSRNSASSRAIPFSKQLERIMNDPFIPEKFPINISGMQPQVYIDSSREEYLDLKNHWLFARNLASNNARILYEKGIHKQIVNRLLEPFQWHTVIVTATEWDNFFKLRCNENAQYEIRRIADLMYEAYHAYDDVIAHKLDLDVPYYEFNGWTAIKPQILKVGEWHCPLVSEEDNELISSHVRNNLTRLLLEHNIKANCLAEEYAYISKISLSLKKRISVARCARVSYLTHDGKRDIEKDLELFERLRTSGHWSPFEHVATPYFIGKSILTEEYWKDSNYSEVNIDSTGNIKNDNFIGWKQYRKEFQDENCTSFRKEN